MTDPRRKSVRIEETSLLMVLYHVVKSKEDEDKLRGVELETFEAQLKSLARTYHFITVAEYEGYARSGFAPHPFLCVLTFDDALKSGIQNAVPLLHRLGIPASFYPCTRPLVENQLLHIHRVNLLLEKMGPMALAASVEAEEKNLDETYQLIDTWQPDINTIYPFEEADTRRIKLKLNYEYPPATRNRVLDVIFRSEYSNESDLARNFYLNVDDIRQLAEHGFEIGCHSHDHEVMSRLSSDEQKEQVRKSVGFLTQLLGKRPLTFAYPFGLPGTFDEDSKGAIAAEDISCAVSVNLSPVLISGDPPDLLDLPRFDVLEVFDPQGQLRPSLVPSVVHKTH